MRKTHLWISLIVGVVAWGAYFTHFLSVMRHGSLFPMILWFLGTVVVVILAEVVVGGLIARLFRRRSRALDEGPSLDAALKASHIALMVMIALTLLAAAALVLAAGFGWFPDFGPRQAGFARMSIIVANALLAIVVIAELTRAAFTLALMPRR